MVFSEWLRSCSAFLSLFVAVFLSRVLGAEVEADLFYVQEENFTEWVAENESIADKLVL